MPHRRATLDPRDLVLRDGVVPMVWNSHSLMLVILFIGCFNESTPFAKTHSRMKDNEFPSACSCPVHWSLVHDQLIIITLLLQHCLSVCLSVCPSVCRQAYCEQGATAVAACGGDGGAMLLFGCIIMCAFCHISATINIILDVSSCQLKNITKLSHKDLI